jgi:BirA family biotin operon repressor/biotin-[acetyl-CoA-carboxylase] ligase
MDSYPEFSSIGNPFIELSEVASTNSYAIDNIQANMAAHGTAYFAHKQTAGKGQRGKQWLTEPSSNIIISCVVDTSFLLLNQQFTFSTCVALAARDFLFKYSDDNTSIKWPNDIYWRDRKAAGILIENVVRGQQWLWAVVGIGMNINQTSFSPTLKNPVSLKQITGKTFDTVSLAKELCSFLETRYQQLKQGEERDILEDYNKSLYKLNQKVILKKDYESFECTVKGVDKSGRLLVSDTTQEHFSFGEVEWVI